jgi:hypothetical protein
MSKRTLYPNKPSYLVVNWDKIVFGLMVLSLLLFFIGVMAVLIYCQTDVAYMHTIQGA